MFNGKICIAASILSVMTACAPTYYSIEQEVPGRENDDRAAEYCVADWPDKSYSPAVGRTTDLMVVNDGGWCSFHLYRWIGDPEAKVRRAYYEQQPIEAPAAGEVRFTRTIDDTFVEYRPRDGFVGRDSFAVRLFPGGGTFRVTALVMPKETPAQRRWPETLVHFDFDAAVLRPVDIAKLDQAAARLIADQRLRVALEGHTDGLGTDDYNDRLSLRRVEAVRDYFVKSRGIPAGRVMMAAFGKHRLAEPARPVADENRRVRVIVMDAAGLARWSAQ